MKTAISAAVAALCLVLILAAPAKAWHFDFMALSTGGFRGQSAEVVPVSPSPVVAPQLGLMSGGGGCCGGAAFASWAVQPAPFLTTPQCAVAAPLPRVQTFAAVPIQAGGCCGGGMPGIMGVYGYSAASAELAGCQQRTTALLGAMDAPALGVGGEAPVMSAAELTHHLSTLTRTVEQLTRTVSRHDAALRAPAPGKQSDE